MLGDCLFVLFFLHCLYHISSLHIYLYTSAISFVFNMLWWGLCTSAGCCFCPTLSHQDAITHKIKQIFGCSFDTRLKSYFIMQCSLTPSSLPVHIGLTPYSWGIGKSSRPTRTATRYQKRECRWLHSAKQRITTDVIHWADSVHPHRQPSSSYQILNELIQQLFIFLDLPVRLLQGCTAHIVPVMMLPLPPGPLLLNPVQQGTSPPIQQATCNGHILGLILWLCCSFPSSCILFWVWDTTGLVDILFWVFKIPVFKVFLTWTSRKITGRGWNPTLLLLFTR